MRKVGIALLVAMSITVGVVVPHVCNNTVYAATKSVSDLKKELQDKEKKRKDATSQKKEKQTELKSVLAKKTELEEQVSVLEDDIGSIDSVISEKNTEIKNKETQIEELSTLIEKTDEQLKDRMVAVYAKGSTSYVKMLLDSKGLSDLFTRITVIKTIVEHDKNLIQTYVTSKEDIVSAKQTIEVEKVEQQEAKTMLVGKKSDLKEKQEEKNELVADLKQDISEIERMEAEGEKQEQLVKQEIQKALAAAEAAEKAAAKKSAGSSNSGQTATPAKASSGAFCWPSASSTRVTSEFGNRIHPITNKPTYHKGMDIAASQGTNVLAAADGTVLTSGWNAGGYGNYITINHGGGLVTLYGHNSKLLVSAGDTVKKGQVIAKVGSTGNSTGPHIHFEAIKNGSVVNPRSYL